MEKVANILFEAKMLKEIARSGFHFLGMGEESVAEHSFMTAFIAYTMAQMSPDIDPFRLIAMCIVHDLPEARIGDLNYVQKQYVKADENKAVEHMIKDLPFGSSLAELLAEFNKATSVEAKLARDADQLALVLELKALKDMGYGPPQKWLPFVVKRIETPIGKEICRQILETNWDSWWFDNAVNRSGSTE